MTEVTKPTKEEVRQWMLNQQKKPIPDQKEIRRQLGWHLIKPIEADLIRI
jgi:hypothetical protein